METRLNHPSKSEIKNVIKLSSNKLPSFPEAAAKLIKVSRDKTASLTDISKIVETDPGISVRVLEIVNSAMYGLKRKITAISEAVVFLGLDEIKKLAIGITVFEKIFKSGNSKQFDRLFFWRHSLCVAALSMEIAKKINFPDPEEAYIAGLLHDIGKIFLDMQGHKNYGEFIDLLATSIEPVVEKERDFTGLGHDDIGGFFCSMWNLPEKLVIAVKYHHKSFGHMNFSREETTLVSIVAIADFLCWTQGMGSFDIIRPPVLPPEVEKTIDLDSFDIIQCIVNMNREIENVSKFYHFVFPSMAQLRENLLWANLKLSKINTKYYYQKNPFAQIQDTELKTKENLSSDLKIGLDLGKSLAKAATIKEVMDIVMYQVGRFFQPLHWSILLKDSKTEEMIFSVVIGTNREKLKGVRLPKGEGIAGYIMQTGEPLIIEDVSNDNRFSTRIDKLTGFKTRSIIGCPLKTDHRIFGVIELVNKISNDNFTDQDLKILSGIAEYAAIAIERAYYNKALKNIATKDSLTGLKNRWNFEHAVSSKADVQKRYGTIFSMLIIKVKLLRNIIETKGRTQGDEFLKKSTLAFKKCKRSKDDLFRYGEDTFIILLPGTYGDDAELVKKKILNIFPATIVKKDASDPVEVDLHTLNAGDYAKIKTLLAQPSSKAGTSAIKDSIANIENRLQSILEEENRKELSDIPKKQPLGKTVSLDGKFIHLKTKESGYMGVEKLSLKSVGFRLSGSHRIRVNDFLDIEVFLNDVNYSIVKRRIVVREIKGNYVNADFYNPPPYAKKLGFYLLNSSQ